MRDLNQCFSKSVTMFIPSRLATGGGKRRVDNVGSGCPLHRYDAQSGVKVDVDV